MRLREQLRHDDTVTIGRNGGPAADLRVEAGHAKEAQAFAIESWRRGLSRADVHVGPITNVLVTTDPTAFATGVRYESWVPEPEPEELRVSPL